MKHNLYKRTFLNDILAGIAVYLVFAAIFTAVHYPIVVAATSLLHGDIVTSGPAFEKTLAVVRYIGYAPFYITFYAPSFILNLFGVGISTAGPWNFITAVICFPFVVAAGLTTFVFLPISLIGRLFGLFK